MKRVPIVAAERICKEYEATQVIILAYDSNTGVTWQTTYGVNEKQCKQAADGATLIMKLLEERKKK